MTMVKVTHVSDEAIMPLGVDYAPLREMRERVDAIHTEWARAKHEHVCECDTCKTGTMCQGMVRFRAECQTEMARLIRRQNIALCNQLLRAEMYNGGFCKRCLRPHKNLPDCKSLGCKAVEQYGSKIVAAIKELQGTYFDGKPLFTYAALSRTD